MLTVSRGRLVAPLIVAVAIGLPAHSDAQGPGGIFWPNFFVGVDLADQEAQQPRYFAEIHLKVHLAGRDKSTQYGIWSVGRIRPASGSCSALG